MAVLSEEALKNIIINADIDEIYSVNNKDIESPTEYKDIVAVGDNKSNSLIFKINRYIDGIDISQLTIQFYYVNAEGYSDTANSSASLIEDDYITVAWLLDSNVSRSVGTVTFIVKIQGSDYLWRSKPCTFEVVETMEEKDLPVPPYTPTWKQSIEDRISALEGGVSIERKITALNMEVTSLNDELENAINRISALEDNRVIDYSTMYVGVKTKLPNFSTISQALECAEQHKDEYDSFDIYINAGTYNEQVYVDLPNVHLHTYTGNKDVKITWYYGMGYTYFSADPSTGLYNKTSAFKKSELSPISNWGGTVIITQNAENFSAENIVFENSFNKRVTDLEILDNVTADTTAYTDTHIEVDRTVADFVATSRAATERASAMVIKADKVEFYKCEFIGSQDTLYFGSKVDDRAYFSECTICGMTDYIFGLGNAVFNRCNLNFCGYSDVVDEYAFITANKNADRGFLFTKCIIDSNLDINPVLPDNSSDSKGYYLGRTWEAGAKTIFNKATIKQPNTFSPAMWFKMSGEISGANYIEANTIVNGATLLESDITDETRKSKYTNSFSWSKEDWFNDWTPKHFEEELQNMFYDFQCNNEGAYNQTLQGSVSTWNGLTLNAQTGKIAPNSGANCTQFNTGSYIVIPVKAECVVTVEAYSGQGNNKLTLSQGATTVTASSDTLTLNATQGEVTLTATGNTYINSISVTYPE